MGQMPGLQELPLPGILTSLSKMAYNPDSERTPADLLAGILASQQITAPWGQNLPESGRVSTPVVRSRPSSTTSPSHGLLLCDVCGISGTDLGLAESASPRKYPKSLGARDHR